MAGMSDYKYFHEPLLTRQPHRSVSSPSCQTGGSGTISMYDPSAETFTPMQAASRNHHERGELYLSLGQQGVSTGSRDSSPEEAGTQKFGNAGAGVMSILVDNVLSHPFIVLRRQCQVHTDSMRYHMSPFSLVRPIFSICQAQGTGVLWKGLGSCLLVKGMGMLVEDFTSRVSSLPTEINRHSSMKAVSQHILLKAISLAVVTPFYSASLVETVQSDVATAAEPGGIFDVFREGFWRVLSWPSTGRLVPLHVLIVPTVAHGLLSYLIYTGIKSVSLSALRRARQSQERKQGALSKDASLSFYAEMTASLIGHATAEIVLFPLETILNRLHLQGTRTLIDNLDYGIEVNHMTTGYVGVIHCFKSILEEEGFSGLYKGFGALVLQYGLQILFIRCVKILLEKNPFGGTQISTVPGPGSATGGAPVSFNDSQEFIQNTGFQQYLPQYVTSDRMSTPSFNSGRHSAGISSGPSTSGHRPSSRQLGGRSITPTTSNSRVDIRSGGDFDFSSRRRNLESSEM